MSLKVCLLVLIATAQLEGCKTVKFHADWEQLPKFVMKRAICAVKAMDLYMEHHAAMA